ncbi:MAG: nucleotidyltransferase family protein [Candidatus Diapherotrites archaeon]
MKKEEKERVTVNIDSALLLRVDKIINGREIRNRSHAFESLITKALNLNSINTAFVLAGGKGTRLKPFTDEIPKPMIPVKGRPIIDYLVELLRKHEVRNIIFALGHKTDSIKEYFGNGTKFGVKITYIEEEKPLGTGGPLKLAKDLLKEEFLMFNGDNLTNINLGEMISFHKKHNALATIALKAVEDPSNFGVMELEGDKVIEFLEKPKNPKSNLVNAGAYILKPEIIDMLPKGFSQIEKAVFPKLAAQGKLYGYIYKGQWFPTDTFERYEKALKEWKGIN